MHLLSTNTDCSGRSEWNVLPVAEPFDRLSAKVRGLLLSAQRAEQGRQQAEKAAKEAREKADKAMENARQERERANRAEEKVAQMEKRALQEHEEKQQQVEASAAIHRESNGVERWKQEGLAGYNLKVSTNNQGVLRQ